MKNLLEIIKIVTKKKVKKIEIFDDQALKNKSGKFNEFYEALSSGKLKNDRDAATYLYECSPQDPKYRQLKSRFRKRLLNTIFFLDINKPSSGDYDRAYFNCNKEWAMVKILLYYGANQTANSLARHILTTSQKYHFSNLIVNCSRILRQQAAEAGDEKEFQLYNDTLKKYEPILAAELQSEETYQKVMLDYQKPLTSKNPLQNEIDAFSDQLVILSENVQSPIVFYNLYLVWAMRFELLRDFETMLEVCGQAEQYMETHPDYYQEEMLIAIQNKKMSAYLHKQDYRKGKVNAEKCLNRFPAGSEPWFNFMELYLLLALHTEYYINAIAIINQATSNPGLRKLDQPLREKWAIYAGYIEFFANIQGYGTALQIKSTSKIFRHSKYFNSPENYPKSHRNYAILLLTLEILQLANKKNFSALDDKLERFKQFALRQLNKEDHYRPIQFIRLLQQLKKAEYDVNNLKNADKYLAQLKEQPFFYRGAIAELEIIPFEKLWDLLVLQFR
ncbi:MAG: hypothetical protein R2828_26215 [Saprospiraceae bacterium]